MKTMEAAEIKGQGGNIFRFVEKNREPVLILRNGKPTCLLQPMSKVQRQMSELLLRRRNAKKKRRIRVRQ